MSAISRSGSPAATRFKASRAQCLVIFGSRPNLVPPDFHQDEPQALINTANLTPLGERRRRAPEAIDRANMPAAVVEAVDASGAGERAGVCRQ